MMSERKYSLNSSSKLISALEQLSKLLALPEMCTIGEFDLSCSMTIAAQDGMLLVGNCILYRSILNHVYSGLCAAISRSLAACCMTS